MFNINQLKNRIASIAKTQKITYAMRLVAMSLYNRTEKKTREIRPFLAELKSNFKLLIQSKNTYEQLRISPNPVTLEELVIIVSSTKGLCGGYHESLRKFLNTRFKENIVQPEIIKIGQKTGLITKNSCPDLNCVKHIESLTTTNVHQVSQEIMALIYEKNYKTVRLFSNRFVNFFSYKPSEIIVYPFSQLSDSDAREQTVRHIFSFNQKSETAPTAPSLSEIFNIEQDLEIMHTQILEQYGISLLTGLLLEALMAEQSARFVSMDAATKNASSALDKLKLQCNKLRQTIITREVAELSRSL